MVRLQQANKATLYWYSTFRNLKDGTCEVVIIVQLSDEFSWAPTVSQSLLARHSNWWNAVIPEGSIMSKVALRKGMRRYEAGLANCVKCPNLPHTCAFLCEAQPCS